MIKCDVNGCESEATRYRFQVARLLTNDARAASEIMDKDLCSGHAGVVISEIWDAVSRYDVPAAKPPMPQSVASSLKNVKGKPK